MVLMLILTVSAWERRENTVFKKINAVAMTRSKCLITLVIDLQPYEELLACLEIEIAKLDIARTQVAQDYLQEEEYCCITDPLAQESKILDRQWKDTSSYLKELELLQTRRKHAILSIIGKAMSVLFMMVSEDDVRVIRGKLESVEKNREMCKVVKECISILNVTRLELAKNRGSINWLISQLQSFRKEVFNVTETLAAELRGLEGFLQQYFQLLFINK